MNPVYFVAWCIFRFLFKFYCGWSVYNPERVPLKGPVILASNHASILDPPLIGSGIHRGINYLARESLFEKPIVGWVLRNWNSVPVDRDGAGAAGLRAIMALRLGERTASSRWFSSGYELDEQQTSECDHSFTPRQLLQGSPWRKDGFVQYPNRKVISAG